MLSLHFLFFDTRSLKSPLLFSRTEKPTILIPQLQVETSEFSKKIRTNPTFSSSLSPFIACAVEKDSQEFELDPDKAREALQQLDQQLQSLSKKQSFPKKQVSPPKIQASDLNFSRKQMMREEMPEISGSFLAYSAVGLFIFTILYNVLFYTVIKPAIDAPDIASTTTTTLASDQSPNAALLQQLPLIFKL